MTQVAIAFAIDLFLLERLHETLDPGVVVGVADAAHAGHDTVRSEQVGVLATGILNAAVGVMHETAVRGVSSVESHVKRCDRKARLQMSLQGPADDTTTEGIEHNCQI